MDIKNHKKALGIFYIIYGILNIIFGIMAYFLMWRIFEFANVPPEVYYVSRLIVASFGTLMLLLSILSIIGGYGMMHLKKWPRLLLLILGCIYLFLFPIGTVLGIYTLVVFLSENETEKQVTP